MTSDGSGATWIASYPKSGNTWLRCLLEAYRRNGTLDINDIRITQSDGDAGLIRSVSPVPLTSLNIRGELLLRPAAIINMLARLSCPRLIKTHFANTQLEKLSPCIPAEITEKAVYVVRDPRSVAMSFARFFGLPIDKAIEAMGDKDFAIGGSGDFARIHLSSWSNHAASWASEELFAVHVVKYEDMQQDTEKELTEVLRFLDIDVDDELVKKAVVAADITRLRKSEEVNGFRENSTRDRGQFFGSGGTRWKDELGPKYIAQIEQDHGQVMELLGYKPTSD